MVNNEHHGGATGEDRGPAPGRGSGDDADRLYASQKPLHNLPRGKNTWNPEFLKIWWFWPASVICIIILAYVYPLVWDFFSAP